MESWPGEEVERSENERYSHHFAFFGRRGLT